MMKRKAIHLDGWLAHAEGASMRGALGWRLEEGMPALRVGMPRVEADRMDLDTIVQQIMETAMWEPVVIGEHHR